MLPMAEMELQRYDCTPILDRAISRRQNEGTFCERKWFMPTNMIQEIHLATVVETLQSIKQSDMSPMLSRIYESQGGPEVLDVLMKYLYA